MCVSLEVSILAYLIGFPAFLYLITYKNINLKWIGIVFSYIVQMQLLEALMWYDSDCTKGLNQWSSWIAYYFTIFQPLASYLVAMLFLDQSKRYWLTLFFIPYFVLLIRHIYHYQPSQEDLCTKPYQGDKNWLIWNWSKLYRDRIFGWIWFISLVLPFFLLPDRNIIAIFIPAYILISWLISATNFRPLSAPSIWCLFQILLPFIIMIIANIWNIK